MKILYTTGEQLWLAENGSTVELPCYRIRKYRETIRQIQDGKAWKTTGRGAQFMGTAEEQENPDDIPAAICGLAVYGEGFLYTLQLDASGGMYRRSYSEKMEQEGHIVSGNDVRLGEIACFGNEAAACLRHPNGQSHIGIYHLPKTYCEEITDGDSVETSPSWSADGRTLYFSTCGIARSAQGLLHSPASIAAYRVNAQKMDILLEHEQFDYLAPKADSAGNLYYIRQPYSPEGEQKTDFGSVLLDVLLFPVRLVKAVFGFLNAFSVLFGGESLRSDQQNGNAKSRQKSQKELFFEGNLIHAEKNLKENAADTYPGLLPRNRVLVRRSLEGEEEVLAKAVLDYCLTADGVCYSNGSHILHQGFDGTVQKIAKVQLASHLQLVSE